jgi:hypothetical protein
MVFKGFLRIFERRGRKGFAESAKEDKENTKIKSKTSKVLGFQILIFSVFVFFSPSFLRPLRNLRALCVQKMP